MSHSHAIFRRPTPESVELTYRRRELAKLRDALAGRESHLATLRNQLNAFEGRYIRQVGVLYVQLDEWHYRLAELKNPQGPSATPEQAVPTTSSPSPTTRSNLDLKSLFREVAKRIHPDHARDAGDEHHRTQLMAQANAALLREDAPLLHRMLHSYDLPIVATDARTELGHTLSLIDHLQRDLMALEAEIEALTLSEMADLSRRTAAAAAEGNDILAELAARVKGQIGIAMSRYERELHRLRHPTKGLRSKDILTAADPHSSG